MRGELCRKPLNLVLYSEPNGQHRRAVPARRDHREPLLPLVEGIFGSWQETPGRRHRAGGDLGRGQGSASGGQRSERGRCRADAGEPAASKKVRSGLGKTAHEISRRREAGDHPPGRAVPATGAPYPGETRHSPGNLLSLVRPAQPWRAGGLERSITPAGPRLEPHSGCRTPTHHPAGARRAGALAARASGALYRQPELFRLKGLGLPPAEGA